MNWKHNFRILFFNELHHVNPWMYLPHQNWMYHKWGKRKWRWGKDLNKIHSRTTFNFFPLHKIHLAISCPSEHLSRINPASLKWWVANADFKVMREAVGWQLLNERTCWLSLQKNERFQIKRVNGSTSILGTYSDMCECACSGTLS